MGLREEDAETTGTKGLPRGGCFHCLHLVPPPFMVFLSIALLWHQGGHWPWEIVRSKGNLGGASPSSQMGQNYSMCSECTETFYSNV